jgi:hypothetical protein
VVPVTKVAAGPCVVTQVKTVQKDGVDALQLGFGEQKKFRLNKAEQGHLQDLATVRVLRDFRAGNDEKNIARGSVLTVKNFIPGDLVQVIGTYNVFAHQRTGTGTNAALQFDGGGSNNDINNNIVYDWAGGTYASKASGISFGSSPYSNVKVRLNQILQPITGVAHFFDMASVTSATYQSNRYFVANSNQLAWNEGAYQWLSYNQFVSQTSETGSTLYTSASQAGFPHPEYDIASYMMKLRNENQIPGIQNYAANFDGFVAAVTAIQDRGTFRPELTAPTVNCYIQRDGFNMSVNSCSGSGNGGNGNSGGAGSGASGNSEFLGNSVQLTHGYGLGAGCSLSLQSSWTQSLFVLCGLFFSLALRLRKKLQRAQVRSKN